MLFHATPAIATGLRLAVKDTHEVKRVAWKDLDSITAMYASHHDWLRKVRDEMLGRYMMVLGAKVGSADAGNLLNYDGMIG